MYNKLLDVIEGDECRIDATVICGMIHAVDAVVDSEGKILEMELEQELDSTRFFF